MLPRGKESPELRNRLHIFKQTYTNHMTRNNTGGTRYRANCLPGPWEPFKRDTVDLAPGATERAGGVWSDTVFRSVDNVGGRRNVTLFPKDQKKGLLSLVM